MSGPRLRRWGIAAGLAAVALGSAYLWWWRPLVLATLRVAADRGLADVRPRAAFRDLDLSGLSTLVLRDVTIGTLDDPQSAIIPEVRLTFDLGALLRTRLDVVAALRRVTLIRPQVTLTAPLAFTATASGTRIGLPPSVRLAVTDGRLLLRPARPGPASAGRGIPGDAAVLSVTDVTGMLEPSPRNDGQAFSLRLTPPGSPRRSLAVRGTLTPLALVLGVDAHGVAFEPLQPWIRPLHLPVEPRNGSVHAALRLELTRSAAGARWTALNGSGPLTLNRVELGIPGLAWPLREISGTARLAGDRLTLAGVHVTAPAVPWVGGGTIDRLLSPVLALDLVTEAFTLDALDPADRGAGHCRLRLDGPAASLAIRAEADLTGVLWQGLEAERARGSFVIPHGGAVTFTNLMAVTVAGTATLSGEAMAATGAGHATWALTTRDPLLPVWSGGLAWTRRTATCTAGGADGLWTGRAGARLEGGRWVTTITAKATTGARLGWTGSVGAAAPHGLAGDVTLANATLPALYLDRRSDRLRHLPAVVRAVGPLTGTLTSPVWQADLAGSAITIAGRQVALSGQLKCSRQAFALSPLRLPGNTTLNVRLPFDGSAATASCTADGLPLATFWPLVSAPEGATAFTGNVFGHLVITGVTGHPVVTGTVEVRALTWRDIRLGTVATEMVEEAGAVKLTRLTIKGPACAADGSGRLAFANDGWTASGSLAVGYLKLGTTDLDARAEVTAAVTGAERAATLKLTSVRINAAAYADCDARWKSGKDGWNASVTWEDLLSSVLSVGAGPDRPVSLTMAATALPLGPVLGAFGLPSPADKLTGTVSLRGPASHVAESVDLRWTRGSAVLKGWVDLTGRMAGLGIPAAGAGRASSVTLTASDGALAPWLPLLRRHPDFAALPEVTGAVEAHGFALETAANGAVTANGWIALKDFTMRGQRLGTGSIRITASPGKTVLEGSLDGEGQYTLYPTTLTTGPDTLALDSAFAWNRVPACKALCGLARGTLTARLTGGRGTATLALSGLTLNDRPSTDVTIEARAAGNRWTLSAPRESPWQAIGTVSAAAARIVTEPDDRCGGAWVIFRGPDGAQLKLSGIWPLPGALERLSVEGHQMRAAPILVLLGAPAMEGQAEANLEYVHASTPPLSGRLSVTGGTWGEFPFDLFEVKGTGTPAHDFAFTSIKVERAGNLLARGSGSLTVFPARHVELNLSVERLRLGYLAPFGLMEDAEASALGRLTIAGDPDDPDVTGSLVCAPGSYTPPTGFSELTLTDGRMDFKGHLAAFTATLADAGGAAVLLAGHADFKSLVPTAYAVDMAAPALIQVDRLPGLFKGRAKGKFRIDGTPARPAIHGDILLEDGRIQSPGRRKHDPNEFGERANWDLTVHFGSGVKYSVEPLGGATLELASLSPRSLIKVSGQGEDFHVTGQVLADSGPLTLFLGKELWKK